MKISDLKTQTMIYYDFMDMIKIIDNKLGYNQRNAGKHFNPDSMEYDEWRKLQSISKIFDTNNMHIPESFNLYQKFKNLVENGKIKRTPYCDFWHWQLDNMFVTNFSNDSYTILNLKLSEYTITKMKVWQLEIFRIWKETFKHISNDDGKINVWVSW